MSKKIKIIFIFGALGGGGAQRQFGWLIDKIDKDKFEPVILTIGPSVKDYESHLDKYPDKEYLSEEAKVNEFTKFLLYRKLKDVCKIIFVRRKGFLKTQKKIYHSIKSENSQIIFFVTPMAAILGGLPSLIYSKAKIVHGVRGNGILLNYEKSLANLYHLCSQFYVDYFVCNSTDLVNNAIKSGIIKSKTKVIYNGVPIFFDIQKQSSKKTLRIGYIGRFEEVKNHDLFFNAIAQLDKDLDFSVHLYGTGSLENNLKAKAEILQISHKVNFEGWATDVSEVLKTLDIVCLTSSFEGFNNSISEAQMHGIPVVTTDCAGSNEIVKNGLTGYVVPRGNAEKFAIKLQHLITNHALRHKFSIAAYSRSRKEFTIEKMCSNYESFFTEISSNH
ncbi:MAG: glycosyltransferase involved in cell wall biosynthesis [Flavobacteriaceae bacterium]|jgi:glycosyltransferase involved in cell wall biosynthesis